ncbi:MAG: VCBS repeat-containing protein [Candidatus Hydrogenedentes bacterium]|nr:VCBS repeat-containing protein [Candidatus Hydrogenedentota bacterium]
MNTRRIAGAIVAVICSTGAFAAEGPPGAAPSPVPFAAHRLGTHRSEAVAVADFNQDGRLDIVAGAFLYLAPEWKASRIRTLQGEVDDQGKGYVDDFMNLPLDVDGDGRIDIVSCGWFCQCIRWHRNTFGQTGDWTETIADTNGNFENGDLVDIDGDGAAHEILAHAKITVWYETGKAPGGPGLLKHVISEKEMNFGGGVGDVNADGRPDVLRPDVWFEAPADPRTGTWREHAWALGAKDGKSEHTPQMYTLDVNADGLADVITSNAHQHGIFWYEQVRIEGQGPAWKQHTIDDTWSQAHSLVLADIDADGTPDLVTGKRFMAHNGSDPDEFGKLGVYWYQLKTGRKPTWSKHVVSFDEGIGSGVNLCAVDIDKDGDVDVVVTGKWGGPVWFENRLKSPAPR